MVLSTNFWFWFRFRYPTVALARPQPASFIANGARLSPFHITGPRSQLRRQLYGERCTLIASCP